MTNEELMQLLKKEIPPIFAATELDRLTGNAVRWVTIQNLRSCRSKANEENPPEECFMYEGKRKVLIVRDVFLTWWLGTLTSAI